MGFYGKGAHQPLHWTRVHHPIHQVASRFFPPNQDGQWPVRNAKLLRNINPFLLSHETLAGKKKWIGKKILINHLYTSGPHASMAIIQLQIILLL